MNTHFVFLLQDTDGFHTHHNQGSEETEELIAMINNIQ